MAQKMLVPLTTLPTANEQTGASPLTLTGAGTTTSREYPELGAFSRGLFLLDVSAASGSGPTLDVVVQGYDLLSGKWHPVLTFAQQTAATGSSSVIAAQAADLDYSTYRAQFTVGGSSTPTFTLTLGCIAGCEEPAA